MPSQSLSPLKQQHQKRLKKVDSQAVVKKRMPDGNEKGAQSSAKAGLMYNEVDLDTNEIAFVLHRDHGSLAVPNRKLSSSRHAPITRSSEVEGRVCGIGLCASDSQASAAETDAVVRPSNAG